MYEAQPAHAHIVCMFHKFYRSPFKSKAEATLGFSTQVKKKKVYSTEDDVQAREGRGPRSSGKTKKGKTALIFAKWRLLHFLTKQALRLLELFVRSLFLKDKKNKPAASGGE